jgi:hypothetical protein
VLLLQGGECILVDTDAIGGVEIGGPGIAAEGLQSQIDSTCWRISRG